ncbi:MAG: Protein of unknown function precursor, partial [Bacteroidetes bacterium]|nr:Protein of unknown function precursor [Bacteroidota bacterium]
QNNSGYYKYDLTRIFLSKSSPSLNTVVYTVSVTQQSENGSVQSTTTSPGFTMITTYSTSTNTQTITLNNTHLYPYPQMPGQFINNTSPPSSPSGYKMRFYFNPVTGNKYCNFRFVAPSTCVEAAGVSDTCLGPSVSCNTNQYTTNYYKLDGYTEQLPTPQNQTTATHAPTYYSSSAVKCGTLNLMSVRDNMSNYNFSIFPNPCSDYLIIESNGGYKIREVRITDLMGRKALGSYTATVSRIDVSTLQKGIYFITLVTEKGEAVRKFAKD